VRWRISQTRLGATVSKKSHHHLRLSPLRPNEVRTCPNDRQTEPAGPKPLVVNVVVVGDVEEEDEGTDIASDIVNVKGEDTATPGYYLRSVDMRKPRDSNDSPISG